MKITHTGKVERVVRQWDSDGVHYPVLVHAIFPDLPGEMYQFPHGAEVREGDTVRVTVEIKPAAPARDR